MWHAYDRRYLVGDRVIYEHKQRESLYRVEYRFVPAVVSKRTPPLLTLTLDDGHTMHGQSQLTLHNDLTTWKPIRRCFFGGDVVNVCRHNAAVLGVVRQDVKIYLLDGGNPAVRVQLLHENGYVYPSVDEMQFCFKLCTGCCIPDTNSTIRQCNELSMWRSGLRTTPPWALQGSAFRQLDSNSTDDAWARAEM